jgi:hypothetical protein
MRGGLRPGAERKPRCAELSRAARRFLKGNRGGSELGLLDVTSHHGHGGSGRLRD